MSCDYRCPYCGSEIEDPEYWEVDPEEEYEVECIDCERIFNVSYYVEAVFRVETPSELEPCGDCGCWNGIGDYCAFGTQEQKEIDARLVRCGLNPREPLANCPLGHAIERGA